MDMKKILQAMDGVSTKPVEGASSMSKFLRIVSEAELNQPVQETEQVPPMPDVTGIQPGSSKDLGNGEKITLNADSTVSYQGGWGTYIYNAQGQHIKTQSPSFAGYSQTTDPTGQVTQQDYQQGPMSVQKGPQGTNASYQIGDQNLKTQISEGANPHKVALPVQMAMQHYQQSATNTPKESVIKKYFAEAEEELQKKQTERKQLIRQYASVIAERVLVKEGIINELPIDATDDPNDPVVYGHEKANPMSLKGRIMQARAQLKELAQLAESDDLVTWEKITRLSKGGMFMGLEQNLEQIRHGINELVVRRQKGGTNARGIDKNIGE